MARLTVDLGELERVLTYIKKINDQPLEQIDWVRGGIAVKVQGDQIEAWKYTGLCNRYFAVDNLLPDNA